MSGFGLEVVLHWVAVGLYIAASVLLANAVVFGHPRRVRPALALAAAGLLPHAAALALRWRASGHGPYMLKYEVLSSNAWIAVAMLLVVLWRRPSWSGIALVALPAAILAVALGLFSNPEIRELPPTLRSVWLIFHISFAKLSAASFLLSVGASTLVLLGRRTPPPAWISKAPSAEALDAFVVRFVGFGFIFWTITIAAGAIWANQSWGRYWGWDPIETWSFISWLVYGTFLHVRLFFKVRGAASAWWALACFGVFILTLLILPFLIPSMHSAYFQ